ncbi:hypothetical protein LG293_16615 (plasmid) [Citricoccus nitrophenolicus]
MTAVATTPTTHADTLDSARATESRAVLHQFGHPAGVSAGSFTEAILRAAAVADPANRRKLGLGFPWLVGLTVAAQEIEEGMDVIASSLQPGADQEPVQNLVRRALFRAGLADVI